MKTITEINTNDAAYILSNNIAIAAMMLHSADAARQVLQKFVNDDAFWAGLQTHIGAQLAAYEAQITAHEPSPVTDDAAI